MKKILILLICILALGTVGCSNSSGSAKKEDEMSIEEKYNTYLEEARKLVEEGNFNDACYSYLNASTCGILSTKRTDDDIQRANEAKIEFINWVTSTNDVDLIRRVQDSINRKDSFSDSISDEAQAAWDELNSYRWWIYSIKSEGIIGGPKTSTVDYDSEGRITKSDINIYSSPMMCNSEYYYTYEYITENGENLIKETQYSIDTNEPKVIYYRTLDDKGRVSYYTRETIPEGEQYNYRVSYENGEVSEYNLSQNGDCTSHWTYKSVDGKNSFVKTLTTRWGSYYYNNYFDQYGNLVKRVQFYENPVTLNYTIGDVDKEQDIALLYDSKANVDSYEYVYCTYEQFVSARETGDFSPYCTSNLKSYLQYKLEEEEKNEE